MRIIRDFIINADLPVTMIIFVRVPPLSLHPAKPLPVVEFVSVVIGGDDVQQKDILRLGVQTGNSELHLRKHLPRPPINTYSSIRLFARLKTI